MGVSKETISLFYYLCVALSIGVGILFLIIGRSYLLKLKITSSKKTLLFLVNTFFLVVIVAIVLGVIYLFKLDRTYSGEHALAMIRLTKIVLASWLSAIFLVLGLIAYFTLKKQYLSFSRICLKFGLIYGFILLILQLVFVTNAADEVYDVKHKLSKGKESVFAIVDQHFEFETPELIDRVIETFAEDMVWEAPARGITLTNHDEILSEYKKITAGILEPVEIVPIRRFASGENVFDDRIIIFTAGKDNVWGVPEGKRVQLRLVHYFKIKDSKIHEEVGYEMLKILD